MTVVIGYFGGPEGHAALRHGARRAARDGVDLVVVAATPMDDAEVLRNWDGLAYTVRDAKLPDPAEDVLQAAQEHDASLVVIGLKHRTPVGKLLLGSHAQRILLEADVPVLAVKSPPEHSVRR